MEKNAYCEAEDLLVGLPVIWQADIFARYSKTYFISCILNHRQNQALIPSIVTLRIRFCDIREVFKKRPNFLKSAPTSTERALRLLNAPSVRFWQQTAICPVSLWALVVKLHPLNWARAKAVRRINDKVTIKELEKQRVYVTFCCELGKNFIETFQLLNQAYGEDCMSLTLCYEWFKRFKEGNVGRWRSQAWMTFHINK